MQSQLYLQGRIASNPELGTTKRGKLWIKALIETELVRETVPGQIQSETITLPISFFSGAAELVKELKIGARLTIGAHLHGTQFDAAGVVKHGVQLIADQVFLPSNNGR